MPNRKDPHWRAQRLADVLTVEVSANPIPYGQVTSVTTIANPAGEVELVVDYDDSSDTKIVFAPGYPMPDMIFEAKQDIDKRCSEIRKARHDAEAARPSLAGKWATWEDDRVQIIADDGPENDEVEVSVWSTGDRAFIQRDELTEISNKR